MEYEGTRRVSYEDVDGSTPVFVPVCEKCGRFVKADKSIKVNEHTGLMKQPNATCSKHGRIEMLFEGFI